MAELTREDLRRLARLGAARRLEELRQEEAAIRAAFPDLKNERSPARAARGTKSRRRRRQHKMSPAARRAVSERMKKYWAERRKAR